MSTDHGLLTVTQYHWCPLTMDYWHTQYHWCPLTMDCWQSHNTIDVHWPWTVDTHTTIDVHWPWTVDTHTTIDVYWPWIIDSHTIPLMSTDHGLLTHTPPVMSTDHRLLTHTTPLMSLIFVGTIHIVSQRTLFMSVSLLGQHRLTVKWRFSCLCLCWDNTDWQSNDAFHVCVFVGTTQIDSQMTLFMSVSLLGQHRLTVKWRFSCLCLCWDNTDWQSNDAFHVCVFVGTTQIDSQMTLFMSVSLLGQHRLTVKWRFSCLCLCWDNTDWQSNDAFHVCVFVGTTQIDSQMMLFMSVSLLGQHRLTVKWRFSCLCLCWDNTDWQSNDAFHVCVFVGTTQIDSQVTLFMSVSLLGQHRLTVKWRFSCLCLCWDNTDWQSNDAFHVCVFVGTTQIDSQMTLFMSVSLLGQHRLTVKWRFSCLCLCWDNTDWQSNDAFHVCVFVGTTHIDSQMMLFMSVSLLGQSTLTVRWCFSCLCLCWDNTDWQSNDAFHVCVFVGTTQIDSQMTLFMSVSLLGQHRLTVKWRFSCLCLCWDNTDWQSNDAFHVCVFVGTTQIDSQMTLFMSVSLLGQHRLTVKWRFSCLCLCWDNTDWQSSDAFHVCVFVGTIHIDSQMTLFMSVSLLGQHRLTVKWRFSCLCLCWDNPHWQSSDAFHVCVFVGTTQIDSQMTLFISYLCWDNTDWQSNDAFHILSLLGRSTLTVRWRFSCLCRCWDDPHWQSDDVVYVFVFVGTGTIHIDSQMMLCMSVSL